MSCCFGSSEKSRTNSWGTTSLLDGATTDESSSYLGSDKGSDPGGSNNFFPSWQVDKETSNCWDCNLAFSIMVFKHHCRRCRNIFCNPCSSQNSQILLFSIKENVRVCDKCCGELVEENKFILNQRPLLHAGESFKKSTMMGLSTKIVTLRLVSDDRSLIYDDESSRKEPTLINLVDIAHIAVGGSLKSFELITIHEKSYHFEASTTSVARAWMESLRIAASRAKEPQLREKVELARRKRKEDEKRAENFSHRNNAASSQRNALKKDRDAIKGKYRINSPN